MRQLLTLLAILFATALSAQQPAAQPANIKNQCTATASSTGTQCKMKTDSPSGLCRLHDPATPRCGATTTAGQPCKRVVKTVGTRCAQHN